jgi:hypothetical protein
VPVDPLIRSRACGPFESAARFFEVPVCARFGCRVQCAKLDMSFDRV